MIKAIDPEQLIAMKNTHDYLENYEGDITVRSDILAKLFKELLDEISRLKAITQEGKSDE